MNDDNEALYSYCSLVPADFDSVALKSTPIILFFHVNSRNREPVETEFYKIKLHLFVKQVK